MIFQELRRKIISKISHISRVDHLLNLGEKTNGDSKKLKELGQQIANISFQEICDFIEKSPSRLTEETIKPIAFGLGKGMRRLNSRNLVLLIEELKNCDDIPNNEIYRINLQFFEALILVEKYASSLLLMKIEALFKDDSSYILTAYMKRQLLFAKIRAYHRLGKFKEAKLQFRKIILEGHNGSDLLELKLEYLETTKIDNPENHFQSYIERYGNTNDQINLKYIDCLLHPDHQLAETKYFALTNLNSKGEARRPDYYLSFYNLMIKNGKADEAVRGVENYFSHFECPITFDSNKIGLEGLGNACGHESIINGPLISIITTAFNSERYLKTSIDSIIGQTYKNWELLVVDDCSNDQTAKIIRNYEDSDSRIRYMKTEINSGTFFSKNIALDVAKGKFITFHDSDDWWHPCHLEIHLREMCESADPKLASISKWFRLDNSGFAILKSDGRYLHNNPASLFLAREVFEQVGYFDSVRFDADSEYTWRIKHTIGERNFIQINVPLAVGRLHEDSITRSGPGRIDGPNFSKPRRVYRDYWTNWHIESIVKRQPLRIPKPYYTEQERIFPAPSEILRTK